VGGPASAEVAGRSERAPRDYTPRHLAEKILRSKSALEGERKQVTVLFADVKGSMELAEQVDSEEWHRVMDRFFQILAEGVHRYEGTINQYTGDGIMALFGAPIAHEDHAQRACYAALRLGEELRRYADELRLRGLNFSVRMGLNSGDVVVGKIGDDLRMDYTAQGHTVGLAQRMEQLAEPGHAYLTQHTKRLVEGFFRLRDLGESKVAGASEPLRVYELEGVGPLRTRLEVAARRGLVRFVGRHGELEQLRRTREAAQAGHGQIVGVVGEAGVGKSRLVYEFKAPLERGCRVLEAFSVSHGKAHAYLPLIDLLKSYFGIRLEDDERRRREKITGRVLTLDRTLEDALPYLFTLLGIAEEETASLAQMDPQIRRRRTLEAVKRVLLRETLDQPCVLIFEDLHWIDAETQTFLDLLSESVATARLLLLVDYRPEYRHGWGSKTYYTQLRLDPLGEEEARELLMALLGEETSAAREGLERLILEKTEGNPFFMEEVVQTLAEEGVLAGERGRYRLERAPCELHIPVTVQGILAARIDRLPAEEKDVLQTLAVIGKEFPLGLLRAVTEQGEEDLYRGLSHLQAGEFIYEQPAFPDPEYTFKHALTQEVAYGSLLGERRKLLHERTARAIEELYRDALDEHYQELAHHYGRTENTTKAVEYLHLAGEQAVQRSAYAEAIRQLSRGVELVATLPESRERARQELLLQLALGEALVVTQGYTAPEAERAFVRARDLSEQMGEANELYRSALGLFQVRLLGADFDGARELAEQLLHLARGTGDPAHLMAAHEPMGSTSYWRGEFSQAREHLEEVIARYEPQVYAIHEYFYGAGDPGVWALNYLGWTLCHLGYPVQALRRSQDALALARELSHPFSEATALFGAGRTHMLRREWQAAVEVAEAVLALSSEHGFQYWVGIGTFMRTSVLAYQGQLHEGIAGMRAILEAMRAGGAVMGSEEIITTLAEAHGKAGQVEEGLALIAEAQEFEAKTGERAFQPEVHRIKGELLLARSPSDRADAEASFRKALDVARQQSAKSWELRAAASLARLWQEEGRKQEARELLAPVYDWFTEGFDTRDLQDAKALLEELA
jgi:class 3 adenylate cyclase/predicted ATPase